MVQLPCLDWITVPESCIQHHSDLMGKLNLASSKIISFGLKFGAFSVCVPPQFPTNGSNQIHIPALSVDGLSTPVVLSPGPQKPWAPGFELWARRAQNSHPWPEEIWILILKSGSVSYFGRWMVRLRLDGLRGPFTSRKGNQTHVPVCWALEIPEPQNTSAESRKQAGFCASLFLQASSPPSHRWAVVGKPDASVDETEPRDGEAEGFPFFFDCGL